MPTIQIMTTEYGVNQWMNPCIVNSFLEREINMCRGAREMYICSQKYIEMPVNECFSGKFMSEMHDYL